MQKAKRQVAARLMAQVQAIEARAAEIKAPKRQIDPRLLRALDRRR